MANGPQVSLRRSLVQEFRLISLPPHFILSTPDLAPRPQPPRPLPLPSNPNRYASAIRSLVVCPPARPDQIRGLETIPVDQGEAEVVLRLLRACDRLETLEWRGIAGWGDEIGLVRNPLLYSL